jgi:hypothetical protein
MMLGIADEVDDAGELVQAGRSIRSKKKEGNVRMLLSENDQRLLFIE